ncbi:MAG: ATP-dependent RecD-like DNA helicase [Chloroflexi bacterium]|nr:ATP-dependent RecD-like DNA helicase [Chloroflexota bacterium]
METLTGVVERITYHNEETGYTVARVTPEGKDYTVTVVGPMIGINVGETVRVTGLWTVHPQYGRQFKAERVETIQPATLAGIEKYLGSGLIKGIGPVTAKRIVRKFGLDTLRVIEEEPDRLLEVLGVGPKRVALIKAAWEEQRHIKDVMVFLQGHGVSTGLAVKIYKQYGNDAIHVLKTDPYRLAREVRGIGFITADKIARNMGIPEDAPERIVAAIAYLLSEEADRSGHVYLPRQELVERAQELLNVPEERILEALDTLVELGEIQVEPIREEEGPGVKEEQAVYLTPFHRAELGVARRLYRLLSAARDSLLGTRLHMFQSFDWESAFAAVQQETGVRLNREQRQAVRTALTSPVSVLTGGPGTGKTTTVQTIIRFLEAAGVSYILASPTGRAAKRLSEATGRPAKTVHRLLEVSPGETLTFKRNETNPLEADMVIVDEASMLDVLLMNHLLKAITPGTHLLLVGDVDQLPSVGAGNVLRDIIQSGVVPVVQLTQIFRQPEGSYIVINAHRINRGQMPIIDNQNAKDFFLFKVDDPEAAADLIVDIVQRRIPNRFGLQHGDIQVLSPMHRGPVGVGNLNLQLQEALNPPAPNKAERRAGGRVFRVGDRVMQIRNNYDKEVYNGDLGRVVRINMELQEMLVDFDGRLVPYDFLELDELVHAYAISVHKSQGSEYPAVVVPVMTTHYVMLHRNLLYTAITRAKELVVLVGEPRAIAIAVRNASPLNRHSRLAVKLRELAHEEKKEPTV